MLPFGNNRPCPNPPSSLTHGTLADVAGTVTNRRQLSAKPRNANLVELPTPRFPKSRSLQSRSWGSQRAWPIREHLAATMFAGPSGKEGQLGCALFHVLRFVLFEHSLHLFVFWVGGSLRIFCSFFVFGGGWVGGVGGWIHKSRAPAVSSQAPRRGCAARGGGEVWKALSDQNLDSTDRMSPTR